MAEWTAVPELVAFNVTERCNLRCRYCFEGLEKHRVEPPFEDVLDVLRQLDEFGVPEILLEGGELFVARFAMQLIQTLPSFKFRSHIISNGRLITKQIANELGRSGISIGISLDGPRAENNLLRGGRQVFDAAIASIKLLVGNKVEVYVNCTVTRDNADLIADLAHLCSKLGVQGLVLQQLHCSGNSNYLFYKDNLLTLPQQEALMSLLPKLEEKYPTLCFVESEVLDLLNVPARYSKVCKPDIDYWPKRIFRCGAGRRFCVIRADLEVIPCGIITNLPCGNLRANSFKDIWQSSEQLTALRELSDKRVDEILGCGPCKYNPICDGGCRGDVFNATGDWLERHPTCPLERGYSADAISFHPAN